MSPRSCLRSLRLLVFAVFSAAASNWLYLAKLSSVGSISEEETCEKLKGLIQRQVQMCKRNLEVMDSVRRGAQLAIEECQYQFRNRRWNCSTLDSLPVFGKVVTQARGRAWHGGDSQGMSSSGREQVGAMTQGAEEGMHGSVRPDAGEGPRQEVLSSPVFAPGTREGAQPRLIKFRKMLRILPGLAGTCCGLKSK